QEHTGGLGVTFSFNHQVQDSDLISPSIHIKGKALYRKSEKLFNLFFDTATSLNFNDTGRIKELLMKHFTNLQTSLNQSALKYAATLSLSHLNQPNRIASAWFGIEYFYKIRHLVQNFDKESANLITHLTELQEKLFCNQGA